MKMNLASFHLGGSHPDRLPSIAAVLPLGLMLLLLSPTGGTAAVATGGTKCTSTLRYNADGTSSWVMRMDPADVQSFQLSIEFDPSRAAPDANFGTNGVTFRTPFSGSSVISLIDPSRLIVSGSTTPGGVADGDRDIFQVVFRDLQPGNGLNPPVVFTVGGLDPSDFIQTLDPLTSATAVIPSAQIGTVSRFATAGSSPFIWDPTPGGYDDGTTGGPGTWDLSSASFDNLPTIGTFGHDPALANVGWNTAVNSGPNNVAVFGGNPGTGLVTVSGTIAAGGLQFDHPGYHLSSGQLALAGPGGATPTIEVRDGAVTVATTLSGSAGLTKTGAGTLILGGTNTFSGTTKIAGGTLQIFADQNLGAAPVSPTPGAVILDGGTLQTVSTTTLNANRGITLAAGGGTIDVATGGNLFYAGVITGVGNLTKVGAGTLTFQGQHIFTGTTTILGGVLVNNGSLAGAANLASGRLRGGGAIGALIVGNGLGTADAILDPASPGSPVLLGSLSLNSDAVFKLTLDSTAGLADQLLLSGNAALGNGIAQLSVLDIGSTALLPGTAFTIIANPSGTTSGFFAGLPDGATFAAGSNEFQIGYNAGFSGNNVVLTVIAPVPEADPSFALAAALSFAGAMRRFRSRRK